jgi:nucleoside-diphosphate-sugar epimerase
MADPRPALIITGVASDLATHVLPFLAEYEVIGLDLEPPAVNSLQQFVAFDLSKEESCGELTTLIHEVKPVGIVHLSFAKDISESKNYDVDRMWHINVAGTARVMEAITEANRDVHIVEKFIYVSDALVYGPELHVPASEDSKLNAGDFPFAVQQMEADQVVQQRAPSLRGCSVFMLRPQVLAGRGLHNYLIDTLRGNPEGTGKRAERLRQKGERLTYALPFGSDYLQVKKQFLHADDFARVIAYILARTEPESQRLTLMNVAGRGEALTMEQCVALAKATLKRVPGKLGMEKLLEYRWNAGISNVRPEFCPYILGENVVATDRLKKFLGPDYESTIHYTNADAFADSFSPAAQAAQHSEHSMAGK